MKVKLLIWNSGTGTQSLGRAPFGGWLGTQAARDHSARARRGATSNGLRRRTSAGDEPNRRPLFRRPLHRVFYDWSARAGAVRGERFQPPPLVAAFGCRAPTAWRYLEREVVYRAGDEVAGVRPAGARRVGSRGRGRSALAGRLDRRTAVGDLARHAVAELGEAAFRLGEGRSAQAGPRPHQLPTLARKQQRHSDAGAARRSRRAR